jgi:hypothetical protein
VVESRAPTNGCPIAGRTGCRVGGGKRPQRRTRTRAGIGFALLVRHRRSARRCRDRKRSRASRGLLARERIPAGLTAGALESTPRRSAEVVEQLISGVVAEDEGDAGAAVANGAAEVEAVNADRQIAKASGAETVRGSLGLHAIRSERDVPNLNVFELRSVAADLVDPVGELDRVINDRSRQSATHVSERKPSVVCTELSEHLRFNLRGIAVFRDAPADEQFIVIGELPDSSPTECPIGIPAPCLRNSSSRLRKRRLPSLLRLALPI